tara:strand:+ start:1562 stop:2362 length:801 start_codon:yes stop_codon:yes gene_type:complete
MIKKKDIRPLVSVIMNCYNGEKFLKESLNSVLNQSYENWELIFWDNISTDDSVDILKQFSDKRIKHYKSNKFEKLYKARNLAIDKAKGNYICFLDVDDIWNKFFIEKHLNKIFEVNCNIVYSKYYIKNEINKKKYINEKKDLPSGLVTSNFLRKYLVGISAVFLKKEIFNHIKFDPQYQIIGDYDFFLRLSLNYKFFSIQEPLLTYRHHANNFTNKNYRIYISEFKNWIKNNKKNFKKKYTLNYLKIYILKLQLKYLISNFLKLKI